jgi:hypothetical protein
MRRSTAIALGLAAVFVVAGCDALAGALAGPAPTPQPCGQVFNPVRCLAMTDAAASQLGTTREDIVAIEIIPEPTPEIRDGKTILQTRSGGPPIDVNVTLADGTTRRVSMNCVGIASTPACVDDPHLRAGSITEGGYRDVPADSTPLPTIAPDALAAATVLRIDRLDIPIDHVGRNEIRLGEALLPNGILTTAEFAVIDAWPAGISIIDGEVSLEIRSMDDGKPFQNYYDHGWREGTERVEAILIFNVFRFEPGAVLSIADVVVR